MTKEEKTLLTKVLCEQLPYNVKVHCKWLMFQETTPTEDIGVLVRISNKKVLVKRQNQATEFHLNSCGCSILPYLRPMSSMTEEEEAELSNILPCGMSFSYTTKEELIIYTDCEGDNDHYFICFVEVQDFLNAHHFDFRGLIPKGLAIAAVGENNPYKEKGGEK